MKLRGDGSATLMRGKSTTCRIPFPWREVFDLVWVEDLDWISALDGKSRLAAHRSGRASAKV